MNLRQSIIHLCNTIINEIDMVVEEINKSKHEKPVFVLKIFSDGTYSSYIADEEN